MADCQPWGCLCQIFGTCASFLLYDKPGRRELLFAHLLERQGSQLVSQVQVQFCFSYTLNEPHVKTRWEERCHEGGGRVHGHLEEEVTASTEGDPRDLMEDAAWELRQKEWAGCCWRMRGQVGKRERYRLAHGTEMLIRV